METKKCPDRFTDRRRRWRKERRRKILKAILTLIGVMLSYALLLIVIRILVAATDWIPNDTLQLFAIVILGWLVLAFSLGPCIKFVEKRRETKQKENDSGRL